MERHTPLDPWYEPGSRAKMTNFITSMKTYKFKFKEKDIDYLGSEIIDITFSAWSYVDLYFEKVNHVIGYNKDKKQFYIKISSALEFKLGKLEKMYEEATKKANKYGKEEYDKIIDIIINEMSESQKEEYDRTTLPTEDDFVEEFKEKFINFIDVTMAQYTEYYDKIEHDN